VSSTRLQVLTRSRHCAINVCRRYHAHAHAADAAHAQAPRTRTIDRFSSKLEGYEHTIGGAHFGVLDVGAFVNDDQVGAQQAREECPLWIYRRTGERIV